MAKGKKKKPAAETGPVDEYGFPAAPDEIHPVAPTPSEVPMKKVDAVRAAIAEGHEKPADGVAFVKKKYGIELTNQQFSNSKFHLAKAGGSENHGSPAAPKSAPKAKVSSAAPSRNDHGSSAAELARAVKTLVEAHGVDAVKGMADVFAK